MLADKPVRRDVGYIISRVALHLLQCNYTEHSPRHFLDRSQRSLKVIESGIVQYVMFPISVLTFP